MAYLSIAQGTIRGTVYDDATGETVPFTNIYVTETQSGTTTDLDGAYSLSLEAGTYSLEFSFLGYSTLTVSKITVVDNEISLVDVRLKGESEILEEVVVTAKQIRNTEAAILTIQKKSPNLLDGISSQTFRKIGDSNAGAAIKRVTGVSVQGGKYVFVRGLGDRYTKTILNSMEVPGLDPDRNTIQMDIFPTNLIDNIIVLKSFTPNIPGDFTGGVINIVTKDFPEEKTINFSAGVGFNPSQHLKSAALYQSASSTDFLGFDNGSRDNPIHPSTVIPAPAERNSALTHYTQAFDSNLSVQRKTNLPNMNFAFSAGNQFNKGNWTLGYSTALNYRNTNNYFKDVEYNLFLKPDDANTFELDVDRQQSGELATNNVLLTGLLGGAVKYKNHRLSLSLMRINNGVSKSGFFNQESFISATNTIQRDNIEYTEKSITNALLMGKHLFFDGDYEIEWKISPTVSQINDKDIRATPFRTEQNENGINYSIEPSEGAAPIRIWRNLEEVNYSGRIDITRNFEIKGRDAKLSIGTNGVKKERDFDIQNYQFAIQRSDEITFTGNANEVLQSQNIWTPETRTGVYVLGNPEPANSFNSKQQIASAYLMAVLPISERITINGGLRAESFVHKYTGQNNSGTIKMYNTKLLNETNLLPAFNMVLNIDDYTNLRGSFSQTVARPSFKELSLAQIYDAIADRFFIGNINLQTTDIQNFDLRVERFLKGGQMFAVSGFMKNFDNPIEIVAFSDAAPADITPRNVNSAQVLGLEIEMRKNLSFLNNNWNNWNLGTNVTIVNSTVDMDLSENGEYDSRVRTARNGEVIETTRQMQGQSPYIVNSYLNYSNPESGLEANLSYNVQGKRLAIVGIAGNPDVFEQPFHSLNMKISKDLGASRKSSISFGVNNILDSERRLDYESFGATNKVYSRFSPNRSFSLSYGLRF